MKKLKRFFWLSYSYYKIPVLFLHEWLHALAAVLVGSKVIFIRYWFEEKKENKPILIGVMKSDFTYKKWKHVLILSAPTVIIPLFVLLSIFVGGYVIWGLTFYVLTCRPSYLSPIDMKSLKSVIFDWDNICDSLRKSEEEKRIEEEINREGLYD